MKLSDFGVISQTVLQAMATATSASRADIAKQTGLARTQVSSAFNRLENMGLISMPQQPGAPWTLTAKGYALLESSAPEPEPAPTRPNTAIAPEPESEPEPTPQDRFAADLLNAMEIEVALDRVRAALGAGVLPARSTRVYRKILQALPPVLVDALTPITDLIESHNHH